jgi:hypothetical protein
MSLAPRSVNLGEATFMSAHSLFKDANDSDHSAKHEWGIYPPAPQAKSSIVTAVSDQRPAASPETDSAVQQCRYCTETLPPGARECPTAGGVPIVVANQMAAVATSPVGGAVYTLESPAQCPECNSEINTIHVIRVMRTQVSFTSTLPRKAYVIVCPACRRLLSAGLSGLL